MQKHSFDIWSPQLRNRRGVDVYLPASVRHGTPPLSRRLHAGRPEPVGSGDRLRRQHVAPARGPALAGRARRSSRSSSASTTPAERLAEYSPFEDARHGGGDGDRYARFLIDTVKPRIDANYRTRKDRASTVVAGSSMGGLISLYAFFRRPVAVRRAPRS